MDPVWSKYSKPTIQQRVRPELHPLLDLHSGPALPILTVNVGRSGRDGEGDGLEDTVSLYYRIGGPRTPVAQRVVLRKNTILVPLDVASPNDDNSEEQPPISEGPWR
jgi:hypothetical protein